MKRALALAILILAAPLAGCGFTPMYAAPGVAPGLAAIDVIAPQGRVGELLREETEDALGRDLAAPPEYRLDIYYGVARIGRGLRIDNVVSRYELELEVAYRLVRMDNGEQRHQGRIQTEVTFDTVDQPYAGITAQQDAEQRAAAEAARQIRLDLATWFLRQAG